MFYWVLLDFTGFLLGYTRFYWVLLGLTMLYRVMPSFRGLNCVLGSFLEGKNTNKWNARRWSRWFGAGVALLFSVAVKKKCHRPAHAIGPSADRTGHAPPIAPPPRHHLAAVLSLHRFLSAFFSSIWAPTLFCGVVLCWYLVLPSFTQLYTVLLLPIPSFT